MLKKLAWILPASIVTTLALPAIANFTLPGRCGQGACFEYTYLSKTPIGDGRTGRLFEVQLEVRTSFDNGAPSRTERKTDYVYCSTSQPHFIFISGNSITATTLNPGGPMPALAIIDMYPIYWATCHNFVGPDFFSEEMRNRATNLGYPRNENLEWNQFELTNIRDILSR